MAAMAAPPLGSSLRYRNCYGTVVPERAYDGLRVALSSGQSLIRVRQCLVPPIKRSPGGWAASH